MKVRKQNRKVEEEEESADEQARERRAFIADAYILDEQDMPCMCVCVVEFGMCICVLYLTIIGL